MIINKNNQSRFEYNSKDHSKYKDIHSHFERGLVAFLGYQALFDADSAVSTAAEASNELNVEQLVQQLEAELDKQDLKQNTELNVKDEDIKGEEKEVQEEDIETSDEDDDDSKEQKDEAKVKADAMPKISTEDSKETQKTEKRFCKILQQIYVDI